MHGRGMMGGKDRAARQVEGAREGRDSAGGRTQQRLTLETDGARVHVHREMKTKIALISTWRTTSKITRRKQKINNRNNK